MSRKKLKGDWQDDQLNGRQTGEQMDSRMKRRAVLMSG